MATSLRKNNVSLTRTACKYRASVRCCFSYRFGAVRGMKISGFCTVLFVLSVRCGLFFLSAYRFGAGTAQSRQEKQHRIEARYLHTTHRTEATGKTTPYGSPIFTFHAQHRTDRKNNTVRKPDIYIPRTCQKYIVISQRSTTSTTTCSKRVYLFYIKLKNVSCEYDRVNG